MGQTRRELSPDFPDFVYGEVCKDSVPEDDRYRFMWARIEQDPAQATSEGLIWGFSIDDIIDNGFLSLLGRSACEAVQEAMPCPVAFSDPRRSMWVGTSDAHLSDFCRLVRKTSLRSLCMACDRLSAEEVVRLGTPIIYRCHAGLYDFGLPIRAAGDGEVKGVLIGGQYRPECPAKGLDDCLREHVPALQVLGQELWSDPKMRRVWVLDEERVAEIVRALEGDVRKELQKARKGPLVILQKDIDALRDLLTLETCTEHAELKARLTSVSCQVRQDTQAGFVRSWVCQPQRGLVPSAMHTVFPSDDPFHGNRGEMLRMWVSFLIDDEEVMLTGPGGGGQAASCEQSIISRSFFATSDLAGYRSLLEGKAKRKKRWRSQLETPLSFMDSSLGKGRVPLVWRDSPVTARFPEQYFYGRAYSSDESPTVAMIEAQEWGMRQAKALPRVDEHVPRSRDGFLFLGERSQVQGDQRGLWRDFASLLNGAAAEGCRKQRLLSWLDWNRGALLVRGLSPDVYVHLYVLVAGHSEVGAEALPALRRAATYATKHDLTSAEAVYGFLSRLPSP